MHRVSGDVTTRVAPATTSAEAAASASHCCSPKGVRRASWFLGSRYRASTLCVPWFGEDAGNGEGRDSGC